MLVAVLDGPLWLQITVFLLVSGITLYLTRGLAKKYVNSKHEKTNADRLMDMQGIVVQTIDNEKNQGQIRVAGQIWSARSVGDQIIEENTHVKVKAIEGVKAMVEPLN